MTKSPVTLNSIIAWVVTSTGVVYLDVNGGVYNGVMASYGRTISPGSDSPGNLDWSYFIYPSGSSRGNANGYTSYSYGYSPYYSPGLGYGAGQIFPNGDCSFSISIYADSYGYLLSVREFWRNQ